jgi:uncharacterized membrane protein
MYSEEQGGIICPYNFRFDNSKDYTVMILVGIIIFLVAIVVSAVFWKKSSKRRRNKKINVERLNG